MSQIQPRKAFTPRPGTVVEPAWLSRESKPSTAESNWPKSSEPTRPSEISREDSTSAELSARGDQQIDHRSADARHAAEMRGVAERGVIEIWERITQKQMTDVHIRHYRRDPDFQRVVTSLQLTGEAHLEQIGREVASRGVLRFPDWADRLSAWAKAREAGVKEAEPLVAANEERQRAIDRTKPDASTRR